MKKDYCEIVFIIDESGSMHSIKEDTIGSFNSIIEKLKLDETNANVSVVTFNDDVTPVYNSLDINEVRLLSDNDYNPGGCTALYDAIGFTIDRLDKRHKEEAPAKTLIYILTDGHENSSKEYNNSMIRKMISWHQDKEDWVFEFVGAGIQAEEEAVKIAIPKHRSHRVEKSSMGMRNMCAELCRSLDDNIKTR